MTRLLALTLFALLLLPTQAEAFCVSWGFRRACSNDWPVPSCWSQRYCRRWETDEFRRYDPRPERIYGYYRDGGEERGRCYEVRKAVGDQHLTLEGAKKAANDAWAGAVRFHLGESAMSLDNARDITYVCSRSSIKEAGSSVTTLGQALQRCEIAAAPCRAPRERGERDER